MLNIKESKIIYELSPSDNNPRNSEGSFMSLKNGKIMFAYSRFTGDYWGDDCPSDIAALYLDSNGNTVLEKESRILIHANEYKNVSNVMSVSLTRMADGELGLSYIIKRDDIEPDTYGRSQTVADYVMRFSTDESDNFPIESEVLCSSKNFRGYYVINNNRVIRTKSGRLLIPSALHRAAYNRNSGGLVFDGRGTVYVFYSDDDGATWNESADCVNLPSASGSNTGMQEPGLVELSNGSIYMYARTDRKLQYESISVDGGLTWSTAQPSNFTSPDSPMKIERSPYSGIYYAVWNPIPNYNGRDIAHNWGRTPIVIADSTDGIHFSPYCVLEDGKDTSRGFCYPAIYFIDDKNILLSYCSGSTEDGCCLSRTTIRKITL